jgi:hypothetical protein
MMGPLETRDRGRPYTSSSLVEPRFRQRTQPYFEGPPEQVPHALQDFFYPGQFTSN